MNRRDSSPVRPNRNQDVLANEDPMDLDEGIGREKGPASIEIPDIEVEEEGRPLKGLKSVYTPSKIEWDGHMRCHIPFRRWCPFCVKGKCKSGAHKRSSKTDEEKAKEGGGDDKLQVEDGIEPKKTRPEL